MTGSCVMNRAFLALIVSCLLVLCASYALMAFGWIGSAERSPPAAVRNPRSGDTRGAIVYLQGGALAAPSAIVLRTNGAAS